MTALPQNGPVQLPADAPEISYQDLWQLLTGASGALVAMFTPDFRCVYLNTRAVEVCHVDVADFDATQVLGPVYAGLLREDIWKVSTFQKAASRGVSIRSVLYECTIVPLSNASGVLLVAKPHAISLSVEARNLTEMLTPRELQILTAIGNNTPVSETCQDLEISAKTFRNYTAMIGRKLNVNSRVEMACIATRAGLVSRPSE
jgi:DNA-binding CsgD family transcriptional regulator